MKTIIRVVRIVAVIAFFVLLAALPLFAQGLPPSHPYNEVFLSRFQWIVGHNAQIHDFRRMREGTSYRIPGGGIDRLTSSDTRGIWGREFRMAYGREDCFCPTATRIVWDYEAFRWWGHEVLNHELVHFPANPPLNREVSHWYNDSSFWIELAVVWVVGVIALLLLRYAVQWYNYRRELRKDPIKSGMPYVPGGILSTEPERLESYFDKYAEEYYFEFFDPDPFLDAAVTRISPIEAGMIVGVVQVDYLDTDEWCPRRIVSPIRAYRARYLFPDGTEEVLQYLQDCMNPVDGEEREFTFTPDFVVVSVPEK